MKYKIRVEWRDESVTETAVEASSKEEARSVYRHTLNPRDLEELDFAVVIIRPA